MRPSLLSFKNMSLVLPGTSRTNFCSMILKLFQNLFFKLIFRSMILKSFQNVLFYPRTQVTLCHIHITVLDDVHNVPSFNHYYSIEFQLHVSLSHSIIQELLLWLCSIMYLFRILTKKTFWLNVLFNISIYLNRYKCFPFYLLIPIINIS
jgi:hypothetical protein